MNNLTTTVIVCILILISVIGCTATVLHGVGAI